jgi:hypothetical protein
MNRVLFAGSLSSVPVKVHDYGGGRYALLDADNVNCWTDPNHRVLLYRLEDVDKVLDAHGYLRLPVTGEVLPKATERPAPARRRAT